MTTTTDSLSREEIPADDPIIRVSRDVAAPRPPVWAAWTDPSRVSHWWGPHGFRTTTHAHDLRPDGIWRFTMHGPDGTDYENRVEYRTIEAPALLAYDHYAGDDPVDRPHFRARITFAEVAGGTRVTLTMRCADMKTREGFIAFGAVAGAHQTLERFAALIEGAPG
jgi:uncharacterized protein YndB with AHSA1/START domain